MKVKELSLTAILLSIVLILAPMTIPLGIIPFSLQTFIVPLVVSMLSRRNGLLLVSAYLILGGIGLPVFANWQSGWGVFAGPTGGYLIGLLFFPLIIGSWEKSTRPWSSITFRLVVAGVLQLFVGTWWLGQLLHLTWGNALNVGFMPFLVVMILKTVCVIFCVQLLSNRTALKSMMSTFVGM